VSGIEEATMIDLGQIAYETYRIQALSQLMSQVVGITYPSWDDIAPLQQAAWRAAANAVREACQEAGQ
jgi:hypothetical protein